MTNPALACLTILLSYLIGAIPFGYLVGRWRGVDIIRQGSGNIGATNVGRLLGRRFGILVFLLDFAKGAVPVLAATWLTDVSGLDFDVLLPRDGLRVAAGLAAFLGHLFPVYLRFHGGKGVATGAGMVAILFPGPAAAAFLTWLAVVGVSRYVSLASLVAGTVLCVLRFLLTPRPLSADNWLLTCFSLLAVGLVFVRHRANIDRLLHGNENRLREGPAMSLLARIIHVAALGLWFGSAVFFSFVVAPAVFRTFERPPGWLPLSQPGTEEIGRRLAGDAVGPIFPTYLLVQGVCGLLALITSLAWLRSVPHGGWHRARPVVLALALATVIAGWLLDKEVSRLRVQRYDADAAVAEAARAAFGTWHGLGLMLNLATLALVAAGMVLAARLPEEVKPDVKKNDSA